MVVTRPRLSAGSCCSPRCAPGARSRAPPSSGCTAASRNTGTEGRTYIYTIHCVYTDQRVDTIYSSNTSNYLGQAGHRSVHQVAAWLGELPPVEGVSGPHGVRVLAGGGPHDVLHLLLGLLQQRYFVDI